MLSTHMDTVPPFFASREDAEHIYGRGACDAKGIIAAMIAAAEKLIESGARNFGLLFVVGEERNSAGAEVAAKSPRGARYLINGEPTENKVALGSKGILRYEIVAHGENGPFGVSGARRIRHRKIARCARSDSAHAAARRTICFGKTHAEYRHDFRRPRAEYYSRRREGRSLGSAGQ